MEFRTRVRLPLKEIEIAPRSKITTLGSCFAQHIGLRFMENKLDGEVNPFGILYNPASIAAVLDELCTQVYTPKECWFFEGRDKMWHSWLHHSDFSANSKEECFARVKEKLELNVRRTPQIDLLIVTFGTNKSYLLKTNGTVVANCHKEVESNFAIHDLSVKEIVQIWVDSLNQWFDAAPSSKVLFTVSPYRYASYGFHQSQLSKATLLLAVEELLRLFPKRCFYFPAYEIVLDELRDYRFYKSDMLHPSDTTIDYIWECIKESYFTSATLTYIKEWRQIKNNLTHRPLHPDSKAYQEFVQQNKEKIALFQKTYPHLSLDVELQKMAQQQIK